MNIYLYLGLLKRLLTTIKPNLESNTVKLNLAAISQIEFEIETLKKLLGLDKSYYIETDNKDKDIIHALFILYKDLSEKAKLYLTDTEGKVRKGLLTDNFSQIRAKLLETIQLSEESSLRI